MIKSIFVGLNKDEKFYEDLGQVGANHLIVAREFITTRRWELLGKMGVSLNVSVNAFDQGGCPLDPIAKDKLWKRIKDALKRLPGEIWLDHFRFDGRWEAVKKVGKPEEYVYSANHTDCKWCEGKDRFREIELLARWSRSLIPKNIKTGYFAVPFVINEHTKLASELGQDHKLLGKIFDLVSPMLYHRMIGKPVSYISDYVKYLSRLIKIPILPIIQIKDMPDNLADKLSWQEVQNAYHEAEKKPSIGVSIFVWEHAIEKDKIGLIKKVFSE